MPVLSFLCVGHLFFRRTCGLDPNIPTLILTECVLVYIDQPQAEALIQALATHVQQACWISYDMIHPSDVFGRTMQQNLRNANFHVPGVSLTIHVPPLTFSL